MDSVIGNMGYYRKEKKKRKISKVVIKCKQIND